MPGRYIFTSSDEAVRECFRPRNEIDLEPRYNIAPTQQVPVLRQTTEGRELVYMRWGLLPFWLKEMPKGAPVIAARSENAATSPMFRMAMTKRRCLMLADGFYEWQVVGKEKRPWLFHLKDNGPFAFAAIWEDWTPPDGEKIESCALFTTESNGLISPIHERMPVILPPDQYEAWLSPATSLMKAVDMMRAFPSAQMQAHQVGKAVSSVKAAGAELIAPLH
ncbi:SOS response-associated peptidase [Dongia soli]|uniref:Abasic site processing protein n=1 Tax=Dongia soli TaxID=600628 RepID=A0ABU5EER9_9PROT|nr:SOS response-associated peptidase [Dongia soli]MDY0884524.1 SOS response-associated peptidase [Dongia soli]